MASTATGRVLTEQFRLQQLGVRAGAIRQLARLWPLWSGEPGPSYDAFVNALAIVLNTNRQQAALLAARYYRAFRLAEGIPGAVSIVMAEPLPLAMMEASLSATGTAARVRALAAGMSEAQATAQAFAQVSGSVGRHVLNGGRETVVETARKDPNMHGFARVTDSDPCAYCRMLASRGPVYWTEATAGFNAHDHCGCSVEPYHEGSAWPGGGKSQEFRREWNEATKGYSGDAALNAYRRYLADGA